MALNLLTHDIFAVRVTSVVPIGYTTHNGYNLTSTASPPKQLVIDGVQVELNDWVFLRAQIDATENGLYQLVRIADIANNITWQLQRNPPGGNLFSGMMVYTSDGAVNAGKIFNITSVDPITAGGTELSSTEGPLTSTPPGGNFTGDILAEDGTIILQNGTNGTDAWFKGNIRADNGDDIIITGLNIGSSILQIGIFNIAANLIFTNANAQILGPANTTDPPYAFFGDTNTGIGYNGIDNISLVTGGTSALTIDSSQNITLSSGDTLTLTTDKNFIIKHAAGANTHDLIFQQLGTFDSSIIFSSAGTGVDAISILATSTTSGINIDCGTNGVDINTTGAISSNVDSIALTATNMINMDAGAGGITMSSTYDNITMNAAGDSNFTTTGGSITFSKPFNTTTTLNLTSSSTTFPGINFNCVSEGMELDYMMFMTTAANKYTRIITNGAPTVSLEPILSLESTASGKGVILGTSGTVPTVVLGGVFTAPAVVPSQLIHGTDLAGYVRFTSGIGVGTIAVTYAQAYSGTPSVIIQPSYIESSGLTPPSSYQVSASSTTGFTITATGTNTLYTEISYVVIET